LYNKRETEMKEELKNLANRLVEMIDSMKDEEPAQTPRTNPPPKSEEEMVIVGWKDMHARLMTFTEDELRVIINYESVKYKRPTILTRLHMRYCILRDKREREQLLAGEILL
jgi:hypothetical protein